MAEELGGLQRVRAALVGATGNPVVVRAFGDADYMWRGGIDTTTFVWEHSPAPTAEGADVARRVLLAHLTPEQQQTYTTDGYVELTRKGWRKWAHLCIHAHHYGNVYVLDKHKGTHVGRLCSSVAAMPCVCPTCSPNNPVALDAVVLAHVMALMDDPHKLDVSEVTDVSLPPHALWREGMALDGGPTG